MKKMVGINMAMNFVFMAVFLALDNWAIQNALEETFVSLTIVYGIVVVTTNALFVARFCQK